MNIKSESMEGTNFYDMFEDEDPILLPPDFSEMVNLEGVALIKEEYLKLFGLNQEQLNEECNTYKDVINSKIDTNIDSLGINPEFVPLLKKVLTFINLYKFKNKGRLDKLDISDNTYNTLKLLAYKSLLLAVNLNEAKDMFKSLAYVLNTNAKDNLFNAELARYIYSIKE